MTTKVAEDEDQLRVGQIVYFKRCQTTLKLNSARAKFNAFGCGVLLASTSQMLSKDELGKRLGGIGLVTISDIREFFGEEVEKQCVEKFRAKYFPDTPPLMPPMEIPS